MSKNIINEYVRNFDDLIDVIQKLKEKYEELEDVGDNYINYSCNDCDREFYAKETASVCPYCESDDFREV
jgi:rubrerythrin